MTQTAPTDFLDQLVADKVATTKAARESYANLVRKAAAGGDAALGADDRMELGRLMGVFGLPPSVVRDHITDMAEHVGITAKIDTLAELERRERDLDQRRADFEKKAAPKLAEIERERAKFDADYAVVVREIQEVSRLSLRRASLESDLSPLFDRGNPLCPAPDVTALRLAAEQTVYSRPGGHSDTRPFAERHVEAMVKLRRRELVAMGLGVEHVEQRLIQERDRLTSEPVVTITPSAWMQAVQVVEA